MPTIVTGVDFDFIAREWRCKWSVENEKKSLEELQILLNLHLPTLKGLEGVKGVQRVVCGGCHDFKVITTFPADNYATWAAANHAPEADVLDAMNKIDGVTAVETQTYTLEQM